MAHYAALTSLLQTLEQIPQPVQQITSLKEKAHCLLAVLEDSSQNISLTINDFEGQIRDASYEAEDIVQRHTHQRRAPSIWSFFLPRSVEHMDLKLGVLEMIIDKFDSILESLSKIKDGKAEDLQPAQNSLTIAGSSRSVVPNETAVGVDEDLLHIKDRLTGWEFKLDVIPIVGMGGSGKTTLARNLYDDSLIELHFDVRAWAVVSQQYDVRQVLLRLLDSTRHGAGDSHQKSIEQLGEILYRSLKMRRYLIVIDDVWDTQIWNEVSQYFPNDHNGSRVILTTRLSEVASYANSNGFVHHMRLLSLEASWDLLRKKVFGEECCPSPFDEIGRKIVQNCKGLPLAIVVVGGLLSKGSKKLEYWQHIAENVMSAITESDDQVMEILSLSYNLLPHHLKACFLYMGIFPEDHVIFVSQLTKLWIAEGFIKPLNHDSLEEVAEDYLKDLVDRSLIVVRTKSLMGGIRTCTIHDLLREFCIKKAHADKFLQILSPSVLIFPEGNINDQRRISILANEFLYDLADFVQDPSARSLLYFSKDRSFKQLLSFTLSCRLLRVLDALTVRFYEFPTEMPELVHLRYLAFLYRGPENFPASISKFRDLQTLIVYRGTRFYESPFQTPFYLPSTIWEMTQLRHLLTDEGVCPCPILSRNRSKDPIILVNLKTLSKARGFGCSEEGFRVMPNLKKLGIIYDCAIWSPSEFTNFVYLEKLEILKCCCEDYGTNYLPVNFAFPCTLRKLTLGAFEMSWDKMTIVGQLPNLEVLKLKSFAFRGSIWEPNEGEFKALKFLLINACSLGHWLVKSTHFPQLQHLRLHQFFLRCIPSEIGNIPTLEMLELRDCNSDLESSAMKIQEEQEALANDTLKVRVTSLKDSPYVVDKYTSLVEVHRTLSVSELTFY